MAYEQVKSILESIRKFHRQLREKVERAWDDTSDPRSKFLLESIRRGEQDLDSALGQYENDGRQAVLETWIQYVPSDEVRATLDSTVLPAQSTPDDVLAWKLAFDVSLAEFYRQLAGEVSAPRAVELFESLATMTEQRLADQSWQARDSDLAPREDHSEPPRL